MRALGITLLLLVCLAPPWVQAKEKCGFLETISGKCKAAKQDEKDKASKELGEAAYSSVNFWYKLIQDYQTGTPDQRRAAQVLAERMFGDASVLDKPQPLQVRLYLRGVDTTTNDLQIAILKDYANSIASLNETIKEGRRSDFNFQHVTGIARPAPAYGNGSTAMHDKVNQAINSNSRRFVSELTDLHRKILDRQDRFEACNTAASSRTGIEARSLSTEKFRDCMKDNVADLSRLLAGMVTPLVENPQVLVSEPISISVPWSGEPYLTVVIPEEQLKLHPDLQIEMVIHITGNPDKVVPEFAANPYEISTALMRQSPFIESRRVDIGGGRLQAETVSLAF